MKYENRNKNNAQRSSSNRNLYTVPLRRNSPPNLEYVTKVLYAVYIQHHYYLHYNSILLHTTHNRLQKR